MYKKKNRTPMIITIITIVVIIAALFGARFVAGRKNKQADSETAEHKVLIYKSTDGSVEYDSSLYKEENDTQVILSITENEMVTLVVKPLEGKYFQDMSINETGDINVKVPILVNNAEGTSKRINFVMPASDIMVNLSFEDGDAPIIDQPEETEKVSESNKPEKETEEGSPYGLTIHGLTPEIIASFDGQFDDRDFLQQFGDNLYLKSVKSVYKDVTDITFAEDEYTGEADADKVYHYIYLNNDPRWRMLATYYKNDKAYLFTVADQDSDDTVDQAVGTTYDDVSSGTDNTSGNSGTTSGGTVTTTPGTSGTATSSAAVTEETSFDIMQVSKTFLKYVGGEDTFYDKAFDYVLLKGQKGHIVGTMSEYKIDPEKEVATFVISLSSGKSISGTYTKQTGSFTFAGL